MNNTRTADNYAYRKFPLCAHEYWSWPDEEASRKEGWIFSNDSDDKHTISRIDDPASVKECDFEEPVFESDVEAQEFVIKKAGEGSRTHLLALYLIGNPSGERLNMHVPDVLLLPCVLKKYERNL